MIGNSKGWALGRKGIIVPLLAFLSLGSWYAWKEFNRTPQSLLTREADYKTRDTLVIRQFYADAQLADRKYNNKIVQVEGEIKGVDERKGVFVVSLGSPLSPSSVLCFMDDQQTSVNRSKQGSRVTIKGTYIGFNQDDLLGSDIVLSRCVFINDQNK